MNEKKLAAGCSEESIKFNINEWKEEVDSIAQDIHDLGSKLQHAKELVALWERTLSIKQKKIGEVD